MYVIIQPLILGFQPFYCYQQQITRIIQQEKSKHIQYFYQIFIFAILIITIIIIILQFNTVDMVHHVHLFITEGYFGQIGAHMGIAIKCADGWYCFEYAAGGASGSSGSFISSASSSTNNRVTINKYDPPGETRNIGVTQKSLDDIIDYARNKSGYDNSKYDLTQNNCRQFARALACYMGVQQGFDKQAYWYAFTKK